MENKKIKRFSIPVEWTVCDKIEVEATSLEEALQFVRDNLDIIPLGTEPEYIDGTYKISDDYGEFCTDIDELKERLMECWNLSGGLTGMETELNTKKAYESYKRHWCEQRGYKLEDIDEEIGINGECYSCFDEFVQNDLLNFINIDLIKG